jgi:cell division protein FtsI (penicillin-binding protein 3)
MEPLARFRVASFAVAVGILALAIASRLVELQVVRSDEMKAQARRQHEQTVEIGGERGAVLDRAGREIAVSVATSSLFAHPSRVPDPARAARLLAGAIDVPEARILERLRSDQPFVWLRRRMDPSMARAVQSLGLPLGKGQPFGFETEGKRFYPQGQLAVHAVGNANIDQHGVEGIERRFDDDLQGDSSRYLAVRDGRGGTVLQLVQPASKPPRDVVLTLDLDLQHVVERELERAWVESGSRAAAAILLDPATGQVLAMANRPTADANRYGEATPEGRRNRAVVDQYEPGSTFKVITAATALELGTVAPEQLFDCQNGSISIAGFRIRDHHPYGVLSVRQILEKSSNVGIIKVGRTIPRERFDESIRKFGFGRRTGIELPGERSGQITPLSRWSVLSPASMSMGQEIAVTALQVASAMATVANGGVRVPPRVVLGTRDASGRFDPAPAPEPVRAVSERTARTMTGILEGVVARGTGTRAAVPGYRLAGKTGTAQKVVPGQGYSHSQFVASFAGFGPVDSPRLAGVLVLDSPSGGAYYGGQVAAPAFGRIMADALAYLRVPPDEDPLPPARETAPAPDAWAARRKPAPSGDGGEVMMEGPVVTGPGQVPDLRGLSLREAVVALTDRGYSASVAGSGAVVDQTPAPGSPLPGGGACAIRLGAPEDPSAVPAAVVSPAHPLKPLAAVARVAARRRTR